MTEICIKCEKDLKSHERFFCKKCLEEEYEWIQSQQLKTEAMNVADSSTTLFCSSSHSHIKPSETNIHGLVLSPKMNTSVSEGVTPYPKHKCRDCAREFIIEPDIKLCICKCGGLVYDADEWKEVEEDEEI